MGIGARCVTFVSLGILLTAAVASAETGPKRATARSREGEIRRAISAAPPSIGAGAAVVEMDEKGRMTKLRDGDNGWTCIPRDPGTPLGHPLCLDRNGLAWMQAAMSGQAPDPDKIGYCYMLEGGTSWSNVDVAATALPPGEKAYITIPPHVMILNARIAEQSGFPSGAHPDTRKPFVMYGGTPYANVTIPLR